jgi:acyl-CoA thioesterase FadM
MLSYQFRLVQTAVTALRRPPIAWTDTVVTEFRAWPWHCDGNWHLNNGRYLYFMDLGRTDWMARSGLLKPAWHRRTAFMLGGATATWRRPIDWLKPFSLQTRLLSWDERWFYFEQVFVRHDGQIAARALVRGLAREPAGNVSIGQMLERQGVLAEPPPFPDELTHWLRQADEAVRQIRVADTSRGGDDSQAA